MSSSSQYYHLFLCFFLLNFSSLINSEGDIVIIVSNQTPNIVKAKCSLEGGPAGEILMESKQVYKLELPFETTGNNTFSCEMKLREKHGVFKLFDSYDTKTCHDIDKDCEWKILEEGLCMLASSDCVMFKWDTTHYLFKKITSEPIKYVTHKIYVK